jgi:hypothetical protein
MAGGELVNATVVVTYVLILLVGYCAATQHSTALRSKTKYTPQERNKRSTAIKKIAN